ncbi:putative quinol monooxygenase [Streptomyces griseosporeus]|uniref:putative quinol monooxygenase n=1 Tax=Streptomyces griseosporeus TaxID=1910 RepID=UPI00379DAD62
MAPTLTVLAEYVCAPGREDRLRTALEAMIEPSLEEPGCLAYRTYADPNRPAHMLTLTEWTDRTALTHHTTTPHHRHLTRVLQLVLAEPVREGVVRDLCH